MLFVLMFSLSERLEELRRDINAIYEPLERRYLPFNSPFYPGQIYHQLSVSKRANGSFVEMFTDSSLISSRQWVLGQWARRTVHHTSSALFPSSINF